MTFGFTIQSLSSQTQDLMIDYVINFVKANGKQSEKVFKLAKKSLSAKQEITIDKKHSFKKITTRKYYPGKHAIKLLINGKCYDGMDFDLSEQV